jgi:hypothetical protein
MLQPRTCLCRSVRASNDTSPHPLYLTVGITATTSARSMLALRGRDEGATAAREHLAVPRDGGSRERWRGRLLRGQSAQRKTQHSRKEHPGCYVSQYVSHGSILVFRFSSLISYCCFLAVHYISHSSKSWSLVSDISQFLLLVSLLNYTQPQHYNDILCSQPLVCGAPREESKQT